MARRVTDTEWLLGLLADGQPHTLTEILSRSFKARGCGLTVHSRAANLRAQGFDVQCKIVREGRRRSSVYQLVRHEQVAA